MPTTKNPRPPIVEDAHLEYLDQLYSEDPNSMFRAPIKLQKEFKLLNKYALIILNYWTDLRKQLSV